MLMKFGREIRKGVRKGVERLLPEGRRYVTVREGANGLYCTGCHDCCRNGVSVSVLEAAYISGATGKPPSEFLRFNYGFGWKKYLGPDRNYLAMTLPFRIDYKDGNCVFIEESEEGSCSIHDFKPLMCRIWPSEYASDDETDLVIRIRNKCPGFNGGAEMTSEDVEKWSLSTKAYMVSSDLRHEVPLNLIKNQEYMGARDVILNRFGMDNDQPLGNDFYPVLEGLMQTNFQSLLEKYKITRREFFHVLMNNLFVDQPKSVEFTTGMR